MASNKTVRKIIQISTQRAKFGDPIDNLESDRIYALCDDGTLWGCTNLYWDDELSAIPSTDNWRLVGNVPQK